MTDLDRNLPTLAPHLARIGQMGILNHIAGRAVPAESGAWFDTTSPVDDSHIARVARSDGNDADAAAKAARAAFPAWRDTSAAERKTILHAITHGIEARAEEIALCECWDTGQALRFMSKAVFRGGANFRLLLTVHPPRGTGRPCLYPR